MMSSDVKYQKNFQIDGINEFLPSENLRSHGLVLIRENSSKGKAKLDQGEVEGNFVVDGRDIERGEEYLVTAILLLEVSKASFFRLGMNNEDNCHV